MKINSLFEYKGWIAKPTYSWFHVYSFMMFFAFLFAFIAIYISAKKRNIPTRPLELFLIIAVPVGIIGASFFGKLDFSHPIGFFALFAFWNPGLSIHGGILTATIAGLIWFTVYGSRYMISLWVWLDLIMSNLFLGQAIGRWGNFFNHEILGSQVSWESLKWLPNWIAGNLTKFDSNTGELVTNVFYQPLFLYESIIDFILWIVLLFIVPNIGKWISRKPWKQNQEEFARLTWEGKWDKVYYEYKPDYLQEQQAIKIIKPNLKALPKNANRRIRFNYWWHYKFMQVKLFFKQNCKQLTKLHNPYKITIVGCGVQGSLWIFLYNLVRASLEPLRSEPLQFFIKNNSTASTIIISLFSLCGLLLTIVAQFIAPYKWRKREWYYEKQY